MSTNYGKLYKVRATVGVMREMARYELSKVVNKSNPICPEWAKGNRLEESYTTWEFTVSGTPNIGRWRSFGVGNIIEALPNM